MSYFLWVEDFENSAKATATNVFGSVFDGSLFFADRRDLKKSLKNNGVFIELSFQDGWGVIAPDLEKKIDYVILDIDLPAHDGDGINSEVLGLLETFEGYQKLTDEAEDEALLKKKCAELKTRAGFYLYTKLVMELGFPKQHILFCSNHAENNKTILAAFETAKIASPQIYQKSNQYVQDWVESRYKNPYSRLRRGIIEGCQYAKNLTIDKLYFNKFTNNNESVQPKDIFNYLEILENFLPLREPANKQSLYKLFIRTLSHEWEAAKIIRFDKEKPDAVLAWIMRNTRHWITHNSSLFSDADEQLIAFLFMMNMRVMFSSADYVVQTHENILLKLFDNESLPEQTFKEQSIPVSEAYLNLRNIIRDENQNPEYKKLNIEEAFYFNEMANNIQLSTSPIRNDKKLFTKLLYQMFWLTTCNPFVDKKNSSSLEIKFGNFNYFDKPYLLKLARSIYNRSFS
ncbi:MAG: hypothetical protein QX199_02615 [Methylococcaceae bacterium]